MSLPSHVGSGSPEALKSPLEALSLVARESATLALYNQELAEAFEKFAQALRAETASQVRGSLDLEDSRRLRNAVDSASQAYLETMRQYVQAFEEAAREME
jgi:hypothetical protein